jgi:hypothetical protein
MQEELDREKSERSVSSRYFLSTLAIFATVVSLYMEHRVPLSEAVLQVLREAAKTKVNDVIFSGQVPGSVNWRPKI